MSAGSVTPTQSKPSESASATRASLRDDVMVWKPWPHPQPHLARRERSAREARRVRGYILTRGRNPSPQPSPTGRGSRLPLEQRQCLSRELDSLESEIEVHIGARGRHAGQPFAQQWAERGSGFDPRVPCLCCFVLDPWHVAQIIDRRKMRRGGEVRI